jgi:hypothetical protein
MTGREGKLDAIDTTVAQPARRYNYWLGGKDNFAVDRESGDLIAKTFPTVRTAAIENRRFLQRAVRFLAAEAGIRQFLDIGTGLPTADNTHEVAQRIAPESRVVYVDNDPMVMMHAQALLTSTPEGRTAYLEDDLRRPEAILARPDLRETLDLSQPVGLMLVAVLHFVAGEEEARSVVRTLLDALAPGSYLVASNATKDFVTPMGETVYQTMVATGKLDMWLRTKADFGAIFDGLELVDPGVVVVSEWRAEHEPRPRPEPADVAVYGAVGRKPGPGSPDRAALTEQP